MSALQQKSALNPSQFLMRSLTVFDTEDYRALFLEALKWEGHLFGPTYESRCAIMDIEWWENRIKPTTNKSYFGLFDTADLNAHGEPSLIGMMGARAWEKDESGKTALWVAAYLKPFYRGRGLLKPLYAQRENWSRQCLFKSAVFFIHNANRRSQEIHEKNDARHTHTEAMHWPDRPVNDWLWYEKNFT